MIITGLSSTQMQPEGAVTDAPVRVAAQGGLGQRYLLWSHLPEYPVRVGAGL